MSDVTIAFVVPATLADVVEDESLRRHITSVKPLGRDETLRFGLEDAASIITIVVGAIELAKFCDELARNIFKRKPAAGTTLVIRTSHDDTIIHLDRHNSAESLTAVIIASTRRR